LAERLAVGGRSVVVTGAAGGIGSALAHRFSTAGARVALLDRDVAGIDALAARLGTAGADVIAIPCDVTAVDDCADAVARVVATWGGVDVLINNAGITHVSPFAETEVGVLRQVMEVNFFGAVSMTSVALPSLLERRGQIVVMSSVAGVAPLALRTGYSASKHALHGCFESLRAELRGTGVGVTLVCPSFVRTGIGDHALGGRGGVPTHPRTETGTPADPADLADAVFTATVNRRRLLLHSRTAKLAYLVSRVWPARYERAMTRRILPGAGAGGRRAH
jgi:NAD(P)-dependent dehydrogenase (short-subunit alcohol dehydrogenase family)